MIDLATKPDVSAREGQFTPCYRVLHVLDHSWPVLSGYAVRSKNLVEAQRSLGYRPHVLTSPLHQLDDPHACDVVQADIPYTRTPVEGVLAKRALGQRWPLLREEEVVRLLERRIRRVLACAEFDIVHAHSPALCGLAASLAARKYHLPFVYEVRAFWEDGAVSLNRTQHQSLKYRASRRLEMFVIQRADTVVGIAQHILDDIKLRGVQPEKLFHVGNGVNASAFPPLQRDLELARQLGLGDTPVLGFIGSLYRFEGVSWLVRAAAELRRRGANFKLLIIGHGEDVPAICAAIQETDAASYVSLLPPVAHEQVRRYYSVIDIMVYPRLSQRITEMVTPLKPLEAMSQAKPVLASSVGGICELVEDENTGLLFPAEDVEGFCRQAQRLLTQKSLWQELGSRGREMVLREKDWKNLARQYETVYQTALDNYARNHP